MLGGGGYRCEIRAGLTRGEHHLSAIGWGGILRLRPVIMGSESLEAIFLDLDLSISFLGDLREEEGYGWLA